MIKAVFLPELIRSICVSVFLTQKTPLIPLSRAKKVAYGEKLPVTSTIKLITTAKFIPAACDITRDNTIVKRGTGIKSAKLNQSGRIKSLSTASV